MIVLKLFSCSSAICHEVAWVALLWCVDNVDIAVAGLALYRVELDVRVLLVGGLDQLLFWKSSWDAVTEDDFSQEDLSLAVLMVGIAMAVAGIFREVYGPTPHVAFVVHLKALLAFLVRLGRGATVPQQLRLDFAT